MIGLAFAVTDSAGPPLDCDFYGFEPLIVQTDDVATVLIDSAETPAVTEETLSAYHAMVESIASQRACLPHRFGVVVDTDRVLDDMARHHDVLVDTLNLTRGRSEWLIRTTLREHDVDRLLVDLNETPPTGSSIDVGRWVHERLAHRLSYEADGLSQRLDPPHRSVSVQLADDGLGFEVVALVDRSNGEFPADVEVACASLTEYADVDLFGPTPTYRFAAAAMSALAIEER